jgi:hypothetical protein
MAEQRIVTSAAGQTIFALMFFTVVFAVVGEEMASAGKTTKPVPAFKPFTIIAGGTVAATLLTLLSHAGEGGERFATGLALISFFSGLLLYGVPVFDGLTHYFGYKPTTTSPTTSPTIPTIPTHGVGTAVALTEVAA